MITKRARRDLDAVLSAGKWTATFGADQGWTIVGTIKGKFTRFASTYDTSKYWPEVYTQVRDQFREPATVTPEAIRQALCWKWGHLNKTGMPDAHERLIKQIARTWPAVAPSLSGSPKSVFLELDGRFGGPKRFITVAFLTHLLRPSAIPIVDQHNFRAVNSLLGRGDRDWLLKTKPSRYEDIELIAHFMKTLLDAWTKREPTTAPDLRELDKFLMMYGKELKRTAQP